LFQGLFFRLSEVGCIVLDFTIDLFEFKSCFLGQYPNLRQRYEIWIAQLLGNGEKSMRIERLEDLPQTGLPVHYLTQDSNEKHDSEGTVGQWQIVCVALYTTEVLYHGLSILCFAFASTSL
jgi:hypothetical protein